MKLDNISFLPCSAVALLILVASIGNSQNMASALPVHNTPTKLSKINIPDRLPLHPDNGRITLPVEPPKYSKRDETYHHNKHLSKNDNGTPFYFVVGDDHILNDLLDGNGNNKAHVWGSDVMAPYEKRDDDMTQER